MRRFSFGKEKNDEFKDLVPFELPKLDTFFENFFKEPFFGFSLFRTGKMAALDIFEKGGKVIIEAELPGLDKKDIKLNLDGDILTISADKRFERELKKNNFYHLERNYGVIKRSVKLPDGVKPDEIKASYKNGILTIEVPKTYKRPSEGHNIEIE